MLSLFDGGASTTTITFLLSSSHSSLHHSIFGKFSYSCSPSQGIFFASAVQTPVSLSGNNWSVVWSNHPASLCYKLDVLGSGTLKPLSVRTWRCLHHRLCIVFSVFDDDDGHKREQTSCLVVGAEIQIVALKRTYIYYCNYLLGFYPCRLFMWNFWSPYNLSVRLPSYSFLPGNITRIVHKEFSLSQISSSTSIRSTTAEPNKCTEHGAIQKGSLQCTVCAVSISCLLCTSIYSRNCDHSS